MCVNCSAPTGSTDPASLRARCACHILEGWLLRDREASPVSQFLVLDSGLDQVWPLARGGLGARQARACLQACRTHVEERPADIEYCESANQDAIGKKCPDWRELCAKVCVATKTVARSGRLIKLETRDKYLDTDSACRSSPNGSGRLIFFVPFFVGEWEI